MSLYSFGPAIAWSEPGNYLHHHFYVFPDWEAMLQDKIAWEGCLRTPIRTLLDILLLRGPDRSGPDA